MSAQSPDPTILAIPGVKKGGTELSDSQASSLVEVVADLDATRPGMFVLRFVQTLAPGEETGIDFSVGDTVEITEQSSSTTLIEGEVTSIEAEFGNAGQRTVVRGYDKSHRLHRARKYRVFTNLTDSDMANQLASEAGLTAGQVDSTSSVHVFIAQVNQTDWEFLKWRAEENGMVLDCASGRLNFRKPDSDTTPGLTLSVLDTLLAFRPRITAPPVSSVLVQAWDESTKTTFKDTVTVSTSTAAKLTDSPETLAGLMGSVEHMSTSRTAESASDVTATAQALAARFGDSFVEAEGVAYGNANLMPGSEITVSDVGDKFNGSYRITAAKHVFNAHQRYTVSMRFSGIQDKSLLALTSNGNGNGSRTPRIEGVVPAVVTNVNDPELRCRVKVKFPWLDEQVESDWARTVQAGGGPDHGAVLLPEVQDEVLVAFEQGDFRRPYILGGLYNGSDKPTKMPYTVTGGKVETRGFVSRLGHKLLFDESASKSGITLQTEDGNFILWLNEQETKITIDAKNGKVEIHGSQDVTIKSDQNVSIEATAKLSLKGQQGVDINSPSDVTVSGMNAKISANAQATVSGNAGLNLTTPAVAKLQGSLVQIN